MSDHAVFNQDTFYENFTRDLADAQFQVLLQSPFLSTRRIKDLQRQLRACTQRGVRVCIFVQALRRGDSTQQESLDEAARYLVSLGGHVTFRPRIHEKLAVIDETVLWDGSLNVLSHYDTRERMTRWVSRTKVFDAVAQHNLDACQQCSDSSKRQTAETIGEAIIERRKTLGVSQRELALLLDIDQSTLSKIESGKRDAKLSTLIRIGGFLRMEIRYLPWFALPSYDQRLEH